ncbi:hypothetical protein V8E53_000123 [Lactarius tabidus]
MAPRSWGHGQGHQAPSTHQLIILTRYASGALFTCRLALKLKFHNGKLKDKLPEDVLLEIFDAYRQEIELRPRYENVWNSRDGWLKLTHVCQHWRRVVLSSSESSCLHMYLLFTQHRPLKEHVLMFLPRFPILVDYSGTLRTTEVDEDLADGVIRHRRRIQGIAFQECPARLLRALSRPFPELKSPEICPKYDTVIWVFLLLFSHGPPQVCDGSGQLPRTAYLTYYHQQQTSLNLL